ncbi:hypothetical protein LZ198_00420 [Myxococcus sp. K15C18031901]|uniref:hypothetical protein n=1 Tax=Myxococcus dinghuensis TaxID=2906761 RepID=UPI0020A7CCE2|nr:hypothetical protein [Myxococcus dinghuensis]MCP3097328.1 hypothetical protein [Myxococcus dinghuensis]
MRLPWMAAVGAFALWSGVGRAEEQAPTRVDGARQQTDDEACERAGEGTGGSGSSESGWLKGGPTPDERDSPGDIEPHDNRDFDATTGSNTEDDATGDALKTPRGGERAS